MNYKEKKISKKNIIVLIFIVILLGYIIYKNFNFNFSKVEEIISGNTSSIDKITHTESNIDYSVVINESNVVEANSVINITSSGTYIFKGTYTDTVINIEIDSDIDTNPIYIVLSDANITGNKENVFNIISAKDVIFNIADNTTNYISQNYKSSLEDYSGAVIYTKEDTVITGSGNLIIETNYNDAINARDDLLIENTNIKINSQDNGIIGRDYLYISDSTIDITSSGDSIKSNNDTDETKGNILIENSSITIASDQDGISAEKTLQINSGTFDIKTGGGYTDVMKDITVGEGSNGYVQPNQTDISSKALKALNIIINDGDFTISTSEDAVHADNELYIVNGTFYIECGDDGLHADNNLIIDNIDLLIENGYEGIEGSSITINSGTIDVHVLDDAINSSSDTGTLTINSGTIYLYSKGDGMDSNGELVINGGTIIIENDAIYTGGDSAIDVTGAITINGGTIIDENGNDIDYETVMHSGSNQMGGPGMNRR